MMMSTGALRMRVLLLALTALFASVAAVSLTVAPAKAATASDVGVLYTCDSSTSSDNTSYTVRCYDTGNTRYRAAVKCDNGLTVFGEWAYAPSWSTAVCSSSTIVVAWKDFQCSVTCVPTPSAVTKAEYARVE